MGGPPLYSQRKGERFVLCGCDEDEIDGWFFEMVCLSSLIVEKLVNHLKAALVSRFMRIYFIQPDRSA